MKRTSQEGELKAAFDGWHGWFFRNRAGKEVTVTLELQGNFLNTKKKL